MIEPGTTFAGYVIERTLGAGGMGEVYVGRHPRLPRSDAIKVLGTQVSGDPQFQARFQREAELAAGLSHPAIVQVYDQGEDDGRLWISMQLIDGTDVGKLAARGPIPVPEVARIISTVADALDFAGARGLVHRDVKPANILVSTAGHVMLTDFGIARMSAEASDLTGTGMTVGTLNYASPEQLQGETIDTRSDQYSLAATAYQLLAGAPPFANTNAVKVITGHLSAPVPPLATRRPGLPAAVDAVLARALSKDPGLRYPSSHDFAAALRSALLASHADPTLPAPHAMAAVPPFLPHAGASAQPRAERPFSASGSWVLSAAVILGAVALVVIVKYVGWTWALQPRTLAAWNAVAMVGVLGIAAYLAETGASNGRRLTGAALFVAAGLLYSAQTASFVYLGVSISQVVAPVVVLLAPLAWAIARRRGAMWAWSLVVAPVAWIVTDELSTQLALSLGRTPWRPVTVFLVAYAIPAIAVGLLGWGIDWLQHRRTEAGAP